MADKTNGAAKSKMENRVDALRQEIEATQTKAQEQTLRQKMYERRAKYNRTKPFWKKVLTFGWFRSWLNNRLATRHYRKVENLEAKIDMLLAERDWSSLKTVGNQEASQTVENAPTVQKTAEAPKQQKAVEKAEKVDPVKEAKKQGFATTFANWMAEAKAQREEEKTKKAEKKEADAKAKAEKAKADAKAKAEKAEKEKRAQDAKKLGNVFDGMDLAGVHAFVQNNEAILNGLNKDDPARGAQERLVNAAKYREEYLAEEARQNAEDERKALLDRQMKVQRFYERKYGKEWSLAPFIRVDEKGKELTGRARRMARIYDDRSSKAQNQQDARNAFEREQGREEYLKDSEFKLASADMIVLGDQKKKEANKFVVHYDHFNGRRMEAEFETRLVGKDDPARVVAKVGKDGRIDLGAKGYDHILKDVRLLKVVLENQPEAYATIPAEAFVSDEYRKVAIAAVQRGFDKACKNAVEDKNGQTHVNVGAFDINDSKKRVNGERFTTEQYAAYLTKVIKEKDPQITRFVSTAARQDIEDAVSVARGRQKAADQKELQEAVIAGQTKLQEAVAIAREREREAADRRLEEKDEELRRAEELRYRHIEANKNLRSQLAEKDQQVKQLGDAVSMYVETVDKQDKTIESQKLENARLDSTLKNVSAAAARANEKVAEANSENTALRNLVESYKNEAEYERDRANKASFRAPSQKKGSKPEDSSIKVSRAWLAEHNVPIRKTSAAQKNALGKALDAKQDDERSK